MFKVFHFTYQKVSLEKNPNTIISLRKVEVIRGGMTWAEAKACRKENSGSEITPDK
jgi:hypothetical protein